MADKEIIMRCTVCLGEGGFYEDYGSAGYYWEDCYVCRGKGTHSFWYWLRCVFWEHMPIRFVEWYDARKRREALSKKQPKRSLDDWANKDVYPRLKSMILGASLIGRGEVMKSQKEPQESPANFLERGK